VLITSVMNEAFHLTKMCSQPTKANIYLKTSKKLSSNQFKPVGTKLFWLAVPFFEIRVLLLKVIAFRPDKILRQRGSPVKTLGITGLNSRYVKIHQK